MREKKNFPLVYVKWDDASTIGEWRGVADYELSACEVETVGYLIKKNRRHIGVASSVAYDKRKGSDYTTIPRKMILEMKELRKRR